MKDRYRPALFSCVQERVCGKYRQAPGAMQTRTRTGRQRSFILQVSTTCCTTMIPNMRMSAPTEAVQVPQGAGLDRVLPMSSAITGIPMSVRTPSIPGLKRCTRSMKTITIVSRRMRVITESILCVSGNTLPMNPV